MRLETIERERSRPADLASLRTLVAKTHRVIVEENVGWSNVVEFQDLSFVL